MTPADDSGVTPRLSQANICRDAADVILWGDSIPTLVRVILAELLHIEADNEDANGNLTCDSGPQFEALARAILGDES